MREEKHCEPINKLWLHLSKKITLESCKILYLWQLEQSKNVFVMISLTQYLSDNLYEKSVIRNSFTSYF